MMYGVCKKEVFDIPTAVVFLLLLLLVHVIFYAAQDKQVAWSAEDSCDLLLPAWTLAES